MTERRLKIATVSIFGAAVLGSTVTLSGSTPPAHHPTNSAQHPVLAKRDR